jgi:tetratricopeptide (TPR) repeat protein
LRQKTQNEMENLFQKAESLANQEKYDDLVALISEMESKGCLHPELLNLKARCIQLAEQPVSARLEDVQKSLEKAITLDKTYFPAFVELGYFQLNVMDKAELALPFFDKAIEIINRIATEAILGKARCIAELKSKEDALHFVEQAKRDIIETNKMDEFMDDV